jgi:hypothetical protein
MDDQQTTGPDRPSLAERWSRAVNEGDYATARRLLSELREINTKPKDEDPDEFPEPSRLPGSKPRKSRSQKRPIWER